MLLTLKAAADRLGICTEVARRELAGLAVRVGNRLRYPEAAVLRYAERGSALRGCARPEPISREAPRQSV